MKTTTRKLGFVCATVVALAFGSPAAVRATEPLDNTPPWGTGSNPITMQNVTTYVTNQAGSGWGSNADRTITPTGDVDYAVIQCGKSNPGVGVTKGTIQDIRVGYTQSTGDIDIQVFDPTGYFLGISQGVSGFEIVNIASLNLDSAVLKVYGFAGATNGYSITVVCQ
jgi:hypothetical protein